MRLSVCVGLQGGKVKAMHIGFCVIPEAGYAVLRMMLSRTLCFTVIFYSFKLLSNLFHLFYFLLSVSFHVLITLALLVMVRGGTCQS